MDQLSNEDYLEILCPLLIKYQNSEWKILENQQQLFHILDQFQLIFSLLSLDWADS